MRKSILIPILLSLIILCGCQPAGKRDQKLVIASIYPYELLLRELLGPDFEVRTLIPANASPHTYSPGPQDIKSLREADLVLTNGFGLETDLERAFTALGDKHLRVQDMIPGAAADSTGNPHVWLSPALMQKLAFPLSEQLKNMFPEHNDEIANNTVDLIASLGALDKRIRDERQKMGSTPLITFHDSFHYFELDYGIENLGSVQSSPGNEPTPRDLASLGELIRAKDVKAICVEPQMDRRSADVLAREFKLSMIELDPLGSSFGVKTLTELIGTNWDRMRKAWQPENI